VTGCGAAGGSSEDQRPRAPTGGDCGDERRDSGDERAER
jgi:hypothetical protein